MQEKKITTLDYLSVLVRWRRKIIINCLIICIIAAGISLVLPKTFKSSTTILPPTGDGAGFGLSSLLNTLPMGSIGLGLGVLPEETNTFLAILNSRTVGENVIQKFDLINRYKSENMEEALRTLRSRFSIKINDEGTVTLSATGKTPFFSSKGEETEAKNLAKDIADFFIAELDRVNLQLKTERATNTRKFIEGRYYQNLKELETAENEFKFFQEKYGVIALPEQIAATIQTAAELKAKIISKEIEVGYLSKFVNESHSKLFQAQTELDELRRKYR
ncbi:MAG: Wzz/FepE/Etk N-terminal domain-containing protein, partial [bacterium]|nr:Wzz/FepE/Etk N-terminal domain-containing protein [bacterium]